MYCSSSLIKIQRFGTNTTFQLLNCELFYFCVTGFLEKNRDTFSPDLLGLIQTSSNKFLVHLFNNDINMVGFSSRPLFPEYTWQIDFNSFMSLRRLSCCNQFWYVPYTNLTIMIKLVIMKQSQTLYIACLVKTGISNYVEGYFPQIFLCNDLKCQFVI